MKKLTFKQDLLWRFLLVAFVPVFILGTVAMNFIVGYITNSVEQTNQVLAQNAKSEIVSFLNLPLYALTHIANGLSSYDFLKDKTLRQRLDRIVSNNNYFQSIYLLDKTGQILELGLSEQLADNREDYLGLDMSAQPFFQQAMGKHQPTWSNTYFSLVSGDLSLTLSVPVEQAVVVGNFSINHLDNQLQKLKSNPGDIIAVLDRNGCLLFHSSGPLFDSHPNLSNLEPVQKGLSGKEGSFRFEWDGEDVIGNILQIPDTGWLVMVAQPVRQAFAVVHKLQLIVGIGLVGVALAAVFIAMAFSRRLSRPLSRLGSVARNISQGSFTPDNRFWEHEEVADLAQNLDNMALAIKDREEALRRSQEYFQKLFNGVRDAVFVWDVQGDGLGGTLIEVNDVACQRYGYSREEFRTMSPTDIQTTLDRNSFLNEQTLVGLLENGHVLYETSHHSRDGRVTPVEINAHVLPLEEKTLVLAVARDISDRKRNEQALRSLVESTVGVTGQACFEKIAEEMCRLFNADCVLLGELDREQRINTLVNLRDEEYVGNFCFDLAGTPCEYVVQEGLKLFSENVSENYPMVQSLVGFEAQSFLGIPLLDRDGQKLGFISIYSRDTLNVPERSEEIVSILASRATAEIEHLRAETQLRENEERLEYLAYHDSLTELPNRLLFLDRLEKSLALARRSGRQTALLFLDLDRFKNINDSLGHGVGDQVLQNVAQILKETVREIDSVARFGGDEFVIILEQMEETMDIALVTQKLLHNVSRPQKIGEHELYLTASVGIAVYPADAADAEGLLKRGDLAMFRAKEEGKNSYRFYTADMDQRAHEYLFLEKGLRQALELNQFELHYQPLYDLATQKMIGLEALVRWNHPDKGRISPADFIPLAEETGLIVPIGEWVLVEACRQAKEWQDLGFAPLRMAVNISSRQFRFGNLADTVALALKRTGLEANFLELEITESTLMENVDAGIVIMHQLNGMGVHLAIDDFGTGYSSLSYLKRFPINKLKIDKSFVDEVEHDSHDAAIASSIIALGHSLGLAVLGEGIENEEQLNFLRQKGCNQGQGYFFSRPLPAKQLQETLVRYRSGELRAG